MSSFAADLSDILIRCIGLGPIGIAGLGIAEKLLPFVPSYVLLIIIGMVVAAEQSYIGLAIVAIAIGSTVGSLCWYGAGLALGETRCQAFVGRFGRLIGLTSVRYRAAADAFERNLFVITALGQTIPTVRVYMALPAGVLSVPLRPFLLGTFIGSLAWSGPLLGLGYWVGETSSDPAAAGLVVVTSLLGLEAVVLLGWRCLRRLRPQA